MANIPDNIIQYKGVGKKFSELVLLALNDATVYADQNKYQSGEYSFRHAMSSDTIKSAKETAKRQADSFVRSLYAIGLKLKKEGKIYEAFYELGIALHTLQDATSPKHNGFQVWTGKENLFQEGLHAVGEIIYPGQNSNLVQITTLYLKMFMSQEMLPKGNLFDNIKND